MFRAVTLSNITRQEIPSVCLRTDSATSLCGHLMGSSEPHPTDKPTPHLTPLHGDRHHPSYHSSQENGSAAEKHTGQHAEDAAVLSSRRLQSTVEVRRYSVVFLSSVQLVGLWRFVAGGLFLRFIRARSSPETGASMKRQCPITKGVSSFFRPSILHLEGLALVWKLSILSPARRMHRFRAVRHTVPRNNRSTS